MSAHKLTNTQRTQDRRAVRPLDILCEAKVSAASPTFIKCTCAECTGSGSKAGYAGGSYNSVTDFLAHGRKVFGPDTIVVLSEVELTWPVSTQVYMFECVCAGGGSVFVFVGAWRQRRANAADGKQLVAEKWSS